MTIPDDFRKQVAEGGLRFQAYLPPSLALRVIELVEQGAFTSPSEAIFVAMQAFQEMERHPGVKEELLRRMLAEAEKEVEQGGGITHEEVLADLEKWKSQARPEPAIWDRSMDRPLFEE